MRRTKLNKLVRKCGMAENHADRFRGFVAEQGASHAGVGGVEGSDDQQQTGLAPPVLRSASRKRPLQSAQGGASQPKRGRL
jgi:hypothetical protein